MNIVTHISLNEDEVLVKQKIKKEKQPNFYKAGNGTMNKDGIQAMNLPLILMDLNKAEQLVIRAILEGLAWDNATGAVVIDMKKFTTTERQTFSRGYSSLVKKDLVVRVARSTYMVNPRALIPKEYNQAQELYNKAKKKADQPEG